MLATPVRKASTSAPLWVRPSEWLALPVIADTTDRTVMLHAVYNQPNNYMAMVVSGSYTVDWGDGTSPENIAAGVQAQHNYVYSATALAAGQMADGTRQAIISITPQSGQSITSLTLHVRHSSATYGLYQSGLLDISIVGPALTALKLGLNSLGATSPSSVSFSNLALLSMYSPAMVRCRQKHFD